MNKTLYFLKFLIIVALPLGCGSAHFSAGQKTPKTSKNRSSEAGNSEGADGSSSTKGDNEGANGSGNSRKDDDDAENGSGSSSNNSPINPSDNGQPVQDTTLKLGINFEDQGLKGDRDYNDDVMCFDGAFRVEKQLGRITSLRTQTIVARIGRNANCGQKIFITITHPDGTSQAIEREPQQQSILQETLVFQEKSVLDVKFQSNSTKCDVNTHTVTEADFVLLSYDICNL